MFQHGTGLLRGLLHDFPQLMSSAFQDASQRQADGPASPSGRNFAAYYSGQDRNKPGVLNRTLSHLNPFKASL